MCENARRFPRSTPIRKEEGKEEGHGAGTRTCWDSLSSDVKGAQSRVEAKKTALGKSFTKIWPSSYEDLKRKKTHKQPQKLKELKCKRPLVSERAKRSGMSIPEIIQLMI